MTSVFDKEKFTDQAREDIKNQKPVFSRFKDTVVGFYEKHCPFRKKTV
jgi:hypothetical protein